MYLKQTIHHYSNLNLREGGKETENRKCGLHSLQNNKREKGE
jgi:hypothetical protein